MLRFAVEIYCIQLAAGRHFLHEHPRDAVSWKERFMQNLRNHQSVREVVADQCRFGLRVNGPSGKPTLAKKPTRFMSSAPAVLESLGVRCQGGHAHQRIQGDHRRAPASQVYPAGLCRAILRGAEK